MNPDLLQYWSPNNKLDPSEISAKNNKVKCLWICVDCGTEFIRTCYRRQESGRCRQCAIKKRDKDQSIPSYKKSLGYLYPFIASTWSNNNPCTPFDVYPKGHSHKYLWICTECGVEFKRACAYRHKSSLCIECSNSSQHKKRATPKNYEESLAYLFPEIASTWSHNNSVTPSVVYPYSNVPKRLWICLDCGEEYSRSCKGRQISGLCKVCVIKNKSNTPPKNKSLSYLYPSIAETWSSRNTTSPDRVYSFSNRPKYSWICTECNSEFERTCADRHKSGKCNRCSFIKIGKKHSQPTPFHSFGDLYPDLLKEYSSENIRNPYSLKPGSNYVASWICSNCEHNWQANCYTRTGPNKSGCPHCCNRNSEPEQILRQSLLPFGASPDSNTKLGKWNVDIYFPEKKTIVEYDGSWWHSKDNKKDIDTRKSLYLLSQGYKVIRIREVNNRFKLLSLNIKHPSYFEIFYENGLNSTYTKEPTPDLLDKITSLL